jgi:radical SAM protein with 4Fe4S-binding SPASM domain
MIYNYDGDVYASDEGRMLAEMGEKKFRLGNVLTDKYEDIVYSDTLLDAIEESFAASAPMCSECAFEPFCGSDPVYHYATQRDFVGKKPLSDFCHRHMAMSRHLITLMREDPEARDIFIDWVN